MRVLLAAVMAAVLASSAWADVTATVRRADERTPLPLVDPNVPDVYRDIMVGTRLTIIVSSSDSNDVWHGGMLRIPWADADVGMLSARGDALSFPPCQESCLPATGDFPAVYPYYGPSGVGFELHTGWGPTPGDWFVLDYYAQAVERCDFEFVCAHEEFPGRATAVLAQVISFKQVPTRDFSNDTIVNFADFASLASQWNRVAVADPNLTGSPDLNADGMVDAFDLALFNDYWLERTDFVEPNESSVDPNEPAAAVSGQSASR